MEPRGVGMAPSIVTLRVFVAHYRWNLGCVEQQHLTSKLKTPATCLVEETVKCLSGATGLTVTGTVREQTWKWATRLEIVPFLLRWSSQLLRTSVPIKDLIPKTTIEIRDVDGVTSVDDICEALLRDLKQSVEIRCVNLTKITPRGQRAAFCEIDEKALRASLSQSWSTLKCHPSPNTSSETEKLVLTMMKAITTSCDASMTRLKNQGFHRPVYWWTPEIAALRKRCLELRRRATRFAKLALDHASYSIEYKKAKKELNNTIKASKMTLASLKKIPQRETSETGVDVVRRNTDWVEVMLTRLRHSLHSNYIRGKRRGGGSTDPLTPPSPCPPNLRLSFAMYHGEEFVLILIQTVSSTLLDKPLKIQNLSIRDPPR
uniref:(California timema) hypothetical protein n=1 Tax=Timema californicum TaxID=61474 RepID=A0A7R9P6X6_TIMCA|nr:unnamed protein product [Timema californicum]